MHGCVKHTQKLFIHIWTCVRVAHPSGLQHTGGLKLWTYQLFPHIPELWKNVTGTIVTDWSQTFEVAPWLHDCCQSSNKNSDWNLRLPRWPKSANMGRTNSLFWITKTFVCWWCVPSLGFHLRSRPAFSLSMIVWRCKVVTMTWEESLKNNWAIIQQGFEPALPVTLPTSGCVFDVCHSVITPAGKWENPTQFIQVNEDAHLKHNPNTSLYSKMTCRYNWNNGWPWTGYM